MKAERFHFKIVLLLNFHLSVLPMHTLTRLIYRLSFVLSQSFSRNTPLSPFVYHKTHTHIRFELISLILRFSFGFGGSFVIVILKTNGIHHMMHSNIDLPGFLIYFLLTTPIVSESESIFVDLHSTLLCNVRRSS